MLTRSRTMQHINHNNEAQVAKREVKYLNRIVTQSSGGIALEHIRAHLDVAPNDLMSCVIRDITWEGSNEGKGKVSRAS